MRHTRGEEPGRVRWAGPRLNGGIEWLELGGVEEKMRARGLWCRWDRVYARVMEGEVTCTCRVHCKDVL